MCLLEKVSSAIGYALFWDRQLCQQWQSHIPPTRHTPLCHQKRYFNRETWWHGGITYCCICTFCHRICLTRCKNIFYGDIGCDKSVFKSANNAPTKTVWDDGRVWLLMFKSSLWKLLWVKRYFYSARQCWGKATRRLWCSLLQHGHIFESISCSTHHSDHSAFLSQAHPSHPHHLENQTQLILLLRFVQPRIYLYSHYYKVTSNQVTTWMYIEWLRHHQ